MKGQKFDKDGWPEGLIVPTEEEFLHGDWVRLGDDGKKLADEIYGDNVDNGYGEKFNEAVMAAAQAEPANYHCGTQCCFVGWMGVAFNGPFKPCVANHKPMSKAHKEFALKFLDIAGEPFDADVYEYCYSEQEAILDACSDVFEGQITAAEANALWIKTGEACGYDLSAFKKKERKRRGA